MGQIILIEGMPGTGKTMSIRNLDPKTTAIIKPNNKELPFAGSRKLWNKEAGNVFVINTFNDVGFLINKINNGKRFKTVIVEDISHIFNRRVMADARKQGFDKWRDMAIDAYNNLLELSGSLRDDLNLVLIGHVQINQDVEGNRTISLLTPGKLLDNTIQIPSYVLYALHTVVFEENGEIKYKFLTNRDGSGREAKSPKGALDLLEDNDLAVILKKIDAFHNGEPLSN